MVNGPEVWTQPGWMMNWWWIDSWMAVFLRFICLLTLCSLRFPENFYFSRKVTTL